VEVFRVDLVLVLKNVVRNAILAVGRAAPPRHVAVRVELELEPTGDETVRLRVLDSSPEALDPEVLFDRRVDRGLGLVAAAVRRYGGAIDVEPEREAPYTKAVVVSFFRVAD
jgi:C4-dicarboxylate-specific signal transduction histidine kinase